MKKKIESKIVFHSSPGLWQQLKDLLLHSFGKLLLVTEVFRLNSPQILPDSPLNVETARSEAVRCLQVRRRADD